MQTVADMRGVGVKNGENFADVLCGRPLIKVKVEIKSSILGTFDSFYT